MIDSLLTASLQGAIAFILVWAVCKALPRLPATWRAWLWRLVLLKFAFTLLGGLPILLPASPVSSPVTPAPLLPVTPAHFEEVLDDVIPETAASVIPVADAAPAAEPLPILLLVWMAGVGAMAFRTAIGFRRARRLASAAAAEDDPNLHRLLDDVGARAAYRFPVALRTTPDLPSPAVLGFGRRALLLPPGFRFRPSEAVEAAFAHEVAHLVRRDCEWSFLGEIVRAVFWFHPLVWLALREGRAEAEIAADRLAREWTDASPREYAVSLLTFVGSPGGGFRAPRVGAGLLHSTHELTRRFEAMALNRYSRRTLTRVSAFGVLPLALVLIPLRVASAPPEPQAKTIDVPQSSKPEVVLLPLKRTNGEMTRLATDEGLNAGGNRGPAEAVRAVKRLEEGMGNGSYTFVLKDKDWRIELLGMSHIEPGRSQSWSIDGKPLPHLLPFGPSSGIPIEGDFERQFVIRYTDKTVRGVQGFFRVRSNGETPSAGERTNTIPIPKRLNGDRVIAIQQGFPEGARTADFVLKYYLVPEPYKMLTVRAGQVVSDPVGWKTRLYSAESFASGKKAWMQPPTAKDVLLSFRKPDHLTGTLRLAVKLRNGQEVIARSISTAFPEVTFSRHPELGDPEEQSVWLLHGVKKENITQIQVTLAKQGATVFKDLPLHPKG